MRKIKVYLNRGDIEKTLIGYVKIINRKMVNGYDLNKKWIFNGPLEYLNTNYFDGILLRYSKRYIKMRKIKLFLKRGDIEKTLIGYVKTTKGNIKGYDINKELIFEGKARYLHHKYYNKFLLHSYYDIKKVK